MKKWTAILVLCLMVSFVYSQIPEVGEYNVKTDILIRDGQRNHSVRCKNDFDMYVSVDNGSFESVWYEDIAGIGDKPDPYTPYTKTFTIPVTSAITKIGFRGERRWRNAFGCTGDDGWWESSIAYTTNACFSLNIAGVIPEWDSHVSILIAPKEMNLYYFNRKGIRETEGAYYYLPDNHRIQIKATSGFPGAIYGWQYQIEGSTWKNFPSSLYNLNALAFQGKDLPGINFLNDVVLQNKNIKVRIFTGCDQYSEEMTLVPLPSAPNILSVEERAPSCSYLNDGKLIVTFDRNLHSNEIVSFTVNTVPHGPLNISALEPGNKYTLTDFASFQNRSLSFIGSHSGHPTYTDDPNTQNKIVSVPVRNPIVLGAKSQDIGIKVFNDVSGKIVLKTELCPCGSCARVIEQFKNMFPDVKIEVLAQSKQTFK